ncbi:hypothetical protein [Corynebacterium urealyticum]|uniref:hypothetical protein n=1 Tax=Corynebacterium urealyticum TaxID=43771 RepID=UPI0011E6E809|nr:hypothetical protein [Corynebacterium urealyticum]TYR15624.1 hypothetical protein FYJ89_03605 [Corynebacterium urealyticum]TYR17960.1 hypothetical protein FYJ88_03805 [Corynebacterium urealyticum]
MLVSLSDVDACLRRPLDEDEEPRVRHLVAEATALVKGHLRCMPDPVPDEVRVVVARMVARVLEAPNEVLTGSSTQMTAGPFGASITHPQGASGGAPWLTATDKTILSPFRCRPRGGVYTIEVT